MDSWEAAIAAVFGSLTGSEATPLLFVLLTWPDAKSEKVAGTRRFREAHEQLADAIAKNIRGRL